MEGILNVTPEKLISTAEEFNSYGSTIQTMTSDMITKVTSLSSTWQGDAATYYINKFTGLEDDIQMMIRMVNEHCTDLEEMASTYENAESQNIDNFANLSSDVIV